MSETVYETANYDLALKEAADIWNDPAAKSFREEYADTGECPNSRFDDNLIRYLQGKYNITQEEALRACILGMGIIPVEALERASSVLESIVEEESE